ncbi:MAG TPA: hypothetical protein DET40_06060 [Lentisphaeria bacterium]|nr:MAG: hypothetical protein A2X45_23210 [Lentisphaerae bacterium GWF2_50_93]HCE43091.1 hypothetical protein [Lentisphaeria bacterium]
MIYSRLLLILFSFILSFGILHAQPLKIIVTGDMHGWLEPRTAEGKMLGGAAEMLAHWKAAEGYSPEKFLVISCGDIATGPAISTAYKGEPAVAVMNMMGYDVSAVGNHEFDFGGVGSLKKIQGWAKFPFVAANLVFDDGSPVDNIPATMMYEEQGIKVGVIGLTLQNLASMIQANNMSGRPYAEYVRKNAAELRAKGAKTIIVVSHVPQAELCALAKEVADLNIPLMLGGHTHEVTQQKIGDTWVVSCGKWWECYGRIDLDVDPEGGRASVVESKQVWLLQKIDKVMSDLEVKAEIDKWREKVIKEYGERLGFTVTGLSRRWAICNLATDSWLSEYHADLAICNLGAFRQDLTPGEVKLSDLIVVMPFDNSLIRMRISGGQLKNYVDTMKREILVFGGAKRKGEELTIISSGKTVEPSSQYVLLINSYLYGISPELKLADPKPETVSGDWRAPVIGWLRKNPTCVDGPIESIISIFGRSE